MGQKDEVTVIGCDERGATGIATCPGPEDAESLLPEATGRYERGEEIGHGALGEVFVVDDRALARQIARKELIDGSDPIRVARFLREARVTASLEHPGVVPVHELGLGRNGRPYYTMRRVRGRTLKAAMRQAKDLSERLALLPHLIDLCQTLAYAHARGIVHRDVKPDNVMVGEFGETVVLDWGLAALRGVADVPLGSDSTIGPSASLTTMGTALGTPAYMSPEQARGELDRVDARADVWAMGVILFELLAGERPIRSDGNSLQTIRRVAEGQTRRAADLVGVPRELCAIADKALSSDLDRRYRDASAMAKDLIAWRDGAFVGVYQYSLGEQLGHWVRRHRGRISALTTFAAALSVIGAVSVRQVVNERDEAQRARAETTAYADQLRTGLAETLVREAGLLCEQGELAECEVFAAESLALVDGPAARGLVVQARSGPRARLAWRKRQSCGWLTARSDGLLACVEGRELVLFGPGTERRFTLPAESSRVSFRSDGTLVVFTELEVYVYDPVRNAIVGELPCLDELYCYGFADLPDGGYLLSGGGKLEWYGADGTRQRAIDAEFDDHVGVAPNGRILVADPVGMRWLDSDGRPIGAALDIGATWLDRLPDGTIVGLNWRSDDPVVHRLDPVTLEDRPLIGHTGPVQAAASGPGGHLFTGAADGTLRVWGGDREIGRLPTPSWVVSEIAVANGIVVNDAPPWLVGWEWTDVPHELLSLDEVITTVVVGSDNLARVVDGAGSAFVVDIETGKRISEHALPSAVNDFVRVGDLFVMTREDRRVAGTTTAFEELWTTAPFEDILFLVSSNGERVALTYAPYGLAILDPRDGTIVKQTSIDQMAAATIDGSSIWVAVDPSELRQLDFDLNPIRPPIQLPPGVADVYALEVSPDRTRLAIGTDGRVTVLDIATGAVLWVYASTRGDVADVTFSSDGRMLAAADGSGNVHVVDSATGEAKAVMRVGPANDVYVAFSADDAYVLTYEMGNLRRWSLDSLRASPAELLADARGRLGLRVENGKLAHDPAWSGPGGP